MCAASHGGGRRSQGRDREIMKDAARRASTEICRITGTTRAPLGEMLTEKAVFDQFSRTGVSHYLDIPVDRVCRARRSFGVVAQCCRGFWLGGVFGSDLV